MRKCNKLTNDIISEAQPKEKPYKIVDGKGLYVLVTPAGHKYFRMKYRLFNKENTFAIGVFPYVSIDEAREILFEAKKLIKIGLNPSIERKQAKKEYYMDQLTKNDLF